MRHRAHCAGEEDEEEEEEKEVEEDRAVSRITARISSPRRSSETVHMISFVCHVHSQGQRRV